MPDASVVIATRNRAGLLRGCLEHLNAQSAAGRFEVVVVDNGSTDETPAVVAAAARAGLAIRLILVAEPNRGKARNAGIAASGGATILFCDDDTLPPRGWVDARAPRRMRVERTRRGRRWWLRRTRCRRAARICASSEVARELTARPSHC